MLSREGLDFIVLGGTMHSGKTGIRKSLTRRAIPNQEAAPMRPDDHISISVKTFVDEPWVRQNRSVQHPELLPEVASIYSKGVFARIRAALQANKHIILNDHASNYFFIKGACNLAKKAGYRTSIVGLVKNSDRYFFSDDVLPDSLYPRTVDHQTSIKIMRDFSRNWERFGDLFDNAALFNTDAMITPVFYSKDRVANLIDDQAYQRFLSLADIDPLVVCEEYEGQPRDPNLNPLLYAQENTQRYSSPPEKNDATEFIFSDYLLWLYHQSLVDRVTRIIMHNSSQNE